MPPGVRCGPTKPAFSYARRFCTPVPTIPAATEIANTPALESYGSAIASSSLATEWLKGKTVEQALAIKNTDIVAELSLPPVKIHCSVLAEDAIKAAIADYKKKQDEQKPGATAGTHAQPTA